MALEIVEIHPAKKPKELNNEWFVLTNSGDKPFTTKNCVLSVTRKNSKKKTQLGTLDPGFTLAPGEKMRVVTGNPGKKAHGKLPAKGKVPHYNLFLGGSVLKGAGTVLVFSLRTHELCSATFDPKQKNGLEKEQ